MNVAAINRAFGGRHVRTGDECYDNVVEFHDSGSASSREYREGNTCYARNSTTGERIIHFFVSGIFLKY